MTRLSRHDAWQAGDSYDLYMGRWSRQIAPGFLEWLDARDASDWLEIGCGTGALSAAILERCNPKSLISIDPSEGFVTRARASVPDRRAEFQVGDAQSLAAETASRDVIVSIGIPTVFKDFDDYWHPFTLGAGPAPGYCMNLEPKSRQKLKERLHDGLPRREDGSIPLKARAWAVKAVAR